MRSIPRIEAPEDTPVDRLPLAADTPSFTVGVRSEGGATVISPAGEIDIATVTTLGDALLGSDGPLVLDLSGVTFLDTSGLRLVVEQQRQAEQDGRPFSLVPGPAHVQRLFDIAGLSGRLPFVGRPPGSDGAAATGD